MLFHVYADCTLEADNVDDAIIRFCNHLAAIRAGLDSGYLNDGMVEISPVELEEKPTS